MRLFEVCFRAARLCRPGSLGAYTSHWPAGDAAVPPAGQWERWDPRRCLFDNHLSANFTANLEHMFMCHGFAVPDPEYLYITSSSHFASAVSARPRVSVLLACCRDVMLAALIWSCHTAESWCAGIWRWGMWVFRVVGWFLYRVQSPQPDDKFKTTDVSLIVPTIDCDEEALTEAIRSWVLNEPFEILIVTTGVLAQDCHHGTLDELAGIVSGSARDLHHICASVSTIFCAAYIDLSC